MFTTERTRQRLVIGFDDDAFPHPLPELRLGGPELFPIATDYQRGLLLLFLVFFRTHRVLTISKQTSASDMRFKFCEPPEDMPDPEGKPLSEVAPDFQNQRIASQRIAQPGILNREAHFYPPCIAPAFSFTSSVLPCMSKRETSSVRRLTPNLEKIFRK